jgi:predicted phosphoribosyltransferase
VVSRGGRPDLAGEFLPDVQAPTLLIVGGDDEPVIAMNQEAAAQMRCERKLVIVPGATHLFPEPGTLEEVARLARDWFFGHLSPQVSSSGQNPGTEQADPSDLIDDCPALDEPGFVFRNREEAGRQLAARLRGLHLHDPLVLGIPRGGVAVGAALAGELGAELDVVLSRKLRAPFQPELAIGSIGEDGYLYLMAEADRIPGVTDDYLLEERDYQLAEIRRRRALFSPTRTPAPIEGRTVILTDDGIATGSTIIAALEVIRSQRPNSLIVAVPVAPPSRLEPIRQLCDQLICLYAPESFWGIGQFYGDFTQVEDEEVLDLLKRYGQHGGRAQASERDLAATRQEVSA